jgi:ABC-2 type transport system ATP-binding protein
VAHPQVLFLDEPTTGLDPRSRLGLWEMIKELVAEGTTLLLTTQYLEEADYLADTLALIDDGTIIARGSVDELKEQIGGDVLDLHICDTSRTQEAADAIAELGTGEQQVEQDSGHITLRVAGNRGVLANTVRILDRHEIEIGDIALRRPSLNEVFLSLTGREANEATATKGATNQ